ncbi:AEC family transporter [Clostridium weizhouense]|uniref:AEC family transporter n=1 Tax=Clostridium weizhouense TaxID=2859781 RepID=A0ABS7AQH7_9CLOT|nr:AEC family transporter [Clostridium weizhouense]MBW6410877.1 AEC family transporter [Clostridium weizhouense]
MISLLLMKQIAQLFLVMLMGFVLVKTHLLKAEDSKSLSIVALYLVMPCVIINAFQVKYTESIRNGLILAFIAAVLIHIVLLILVKILEKIFHLDAVEKASIIYSNAGNLIIPIVTSILGKEWVIYSSAFISVQLILLWTHGKMLLCEEQKVDLKKILLNINMITIFFGILLFITRLQLPDIITKTMESVSVMIGPICMIVVGMLIGNMSFKQIFAYNRIYIVTFLKMIVCPVIILLILKYSQMANLLSNGKMILLISLLATITPSASTVTQMTQIYEKNGEYASVINVVTTIICIITMPIMVWLYQI